LGEGLDSARVKGKEAKHTVLGGPPECPAGEFKSGLNQKYEHQPRDEAVNRALLDPQAKLVGGAHS
jgi:hypothetical protein